jgi:hypothetical protein
LEVRGIVRRSQVSADEVRAALIVARRARPSSLTRGSGGGRCSSSCRGRCGNNRRGRNYTLEIWRIVACSQISAVVVRAALIVARGARSYSLTRGSGAGRCSSFFNGGRCGDGCTLLHASDIHALCRRCSRRATEVYPAVTRGFIIFEEIYSSSRSEVHACL